MPISSINREQRKRTDRRNPEEADDARETARLVDSLMGRKPELRLAFIQEHARFVEDLDV